MSQCPGCGISYCLDCEKAVEPNVYRCEPCRVEFDANDPYAKSCVELGKEVVELERRNKDLNAENVMCRRVNAELREQSGRVHAESERLRRALLMICDAVDTETTSDYQNGLAYAAGIALVALAAKEEE